MRVGDQWAMEAEAQMRNHAGMYPASMTGFVADTHAGAGGERPPSVTVDGGLLEGPPLFEDGPVLVLVDGACVPEDEAHVPPIFGDGEQLAFGGEAWQHVPAGMYPSLTNETMPEVIADQVVASPVFEQQHDFFGAEAWQQVPAGMYPSSTNETMPEAIADQGADAPAFFGQQPVVSGDEMQWQAPVGMYPSSTNGLVPEVVADQGAAAPAPFVGQQHLPAFEGAAQPTLQGEANAPSTEGGEAQPPAAAGMYPLSAKESVANKGAASGKGKYAHVCRVCPWKAPKGAPPKDPEKRSKIMEGCKRHLYRWQGEGGELDPVLGVCPGVDDPGFRATTGRNQRHNSRMAAAKEAELRQQWEKEQEQQRVGQQLWYSQQLHVSELQQQSLQQLRQGHQQQQPQFFPRQMQPNGFGFWPA